MSAAEQLTDELDRLRAWPPLMKTSVAAKYCGLTISGLHSACRRGEVRYAGRRGGRGSLMWSKAELNRYLRKSGLPVPTEKSTRRVLRRQIDSAASGKEWVYVLREKDGDRIKIGRTAHPDPVPRILSHLRSSSQGRELEVVAILRGSESLERQLHARFAVHLAPGKREWFACAGSLAASVADRFVGVARELGCEWWELEADGDEA